MYAGFRCADIAADPCANDSDGSHLSVPEKGEMDGSAVADRSGRGERIYRVHTGEMDRERGEGRLQDTDLQYIYGERLLSDLEIKNIRVVDVDYSDHKPIVAEFQTK